MPRPSKEVDDKPKTIGTIRWLLSFVRRAPRLSAGILLFSLAVNLLLLVSPLYMLQIYDRVLTSGSVDTLFWISVIAVFLLAIYSAAEAGRRRLLALAGEKIDRQFAPRMFQRFASVDDTRPGLPRDLSNLSRVQGLLQNGGLLAFFDLPFTPLFIGLLFLLNPALGVLGLAGAALVFVVAIISEFSTRLPGRQAMAANSELQELTQGVSRQRSAIVAMGLTGRLFGRWKAKREQANSYALTAARGDGGFAALSRSLRQILQVMILGAGAALALSQHISPGGIVAGSVIMSRALAPVDQIVGAWRTLVMARASWGDLVGRLRSDLDARPFTPMPRPEGRLKLDRLAIGAPGADEALVRPFTYDVSGGTTIAILGGNGAGKTTLLQTLAGVWAPASGHVALGDRDIHDWSSDDRGQYVGYVPQDVELVPGTVAENISRFQDERLEDVFKASAAVGAHNLISSLPNGYDTQVGAGGVHLSAGQRQMIGLARAFFGEPTLLLLDEPTANLDRDASEKVRAAIQMRAAAGTIVFATTHDETLIRSMSVALLIKNGAVLSASTKDLSFESRVLDANPRLSEARG